MEPFRIKRSIRRYSRFAIDCNNLIGRDISRMILKKLRKIKLLSRNKKREEIQKLIRNCNKVINQFFDKLKPLLTSSRYSRLDISCWLVFDGRKLGIKKDKEYFEWPNYTQNYEKVQNKKQNE